MFPSFLIILPLSRLEMSEVAYRVTLTTDFTTTPPILKLILIHFTLLLHHFFITKIKSGNWLNLDDLWRTTCQVNHFLFRTLSTLCTFKLHDRWLTSQVQIVQLGDESSEQDAWPVREKYKNVFSWHFDGEPYPIHEIQKFLIPVLFTLWRWIAFHTIAFLNGSDPKSLSTPKSESINLLNPAPGLFKINVIKYDAQANLKHTSTNFTRDQSPDPPGSHMILLLVNY